MSEAGMKLPVEPLSSDGSENKTVLSVVQTAGAQLSAARAQLGLSVQQVADQLKLSQRQILALENNQFDDLPKMVIVRGFVRSYAKLLKLDPLTVINSLPSESGATGLETDLRPTLATPFMESRTPFLGRQDTNNRKYLIGAALLAFGAVIFIALQKLEQTEYFKTLLSSQSVKKAPEVTPEKVAEKSDDKVESAAASSVVEKPATATIPTVLATANEMKPEPQEQVASLPKMNQEEKVASNVATAASNASPLVPVQATEPANAQVNSLSGNSSNNQLKLKFKQDSWIQVKRENGTVLTSHLAKAGTEEVFDMKDALQLRIGNAAGVEAMLRGKAMEIVPPKDSNVANVNVK